MPSATTKFLEEGLKRLEYREGMNGKPVSLKQGAIELKWENGVFTFRHFAHVIIELNFLAGAKDDINSLVTKWFISSPTDSRYVKQALNYWGVNTSNLDIGYGSVNSYRFNYKDAEGKWTEVNNYHDNY